MPLTVEAFLASLKYFWIFVFVPAFAFIYTRQEKHKDNTYTKEETETLVDSKIELVDSRIESILRELKRGHRVQRENTEEVKKLNETLTNLRIKMAETKQ